MSLIGFDIDGVISSDFQFPPNSVVISGRTFYEYDDFCKKLAQEVPVYIRGSGIFGDRIDAGNFKSEMINRLGVTEFHEDDPIQINIIRLNTNVRIIEYKRN